MCACARACVECVSFYFSFCGALSFFISPKASHSVFRGQMEATGSERQKFVAEVPNYGNTESFFSFHYLVSAHEQVTPPTSGVVPSQGDFPLAHQTLEDRSHDPLTFHPQEEVNASLHAECCQEFRRHCRCAAVPPPPKQPDASGISDTPPQRLCRFKANHSFTLPDLHNCLSAHYRHPAAKSPPTHPRCCAPRLPGLQVTGTKYGCVFAFVQGYVENYFLFSPIHAACWRLHCSASLFCVCVGGEGVRMAPPTVCLLR